MDLAHPLSRAGPAKAMSRRRQRALTRAEQQHTVCLPTSLTGLKEKGKRGDHGIIHSAYLDWLHSKYGRADARAQKRRAGRTPGALRPRAGEPYPATVRLFRLSLVRGRTSQMGNWHAGARPHRYFAPGPHSRPPNQQPGTTLHLSAGRGDTNPLAGRCGLRAEQRCPNRMPDAALETMQIPKQGPFDENRICWGRARPTPFT